MTLPAWQEERIARHHARQKFDCGQQDLNTFLARYARQASDSAASKTFVAVDVRDGATVLGYYTLSPAHIEVELVPSAARPAGAGRHPLGAFRLARLAVGLVWQGRGLGGQLLIRAARRCMIASEQVGGALMVIDAKDPAAADWYQAYGAHPVPGAPLLLVLPFATVLAAQDQARAQ